MKSQHIQPLPTDMETCTLLFIAEDQFLHFLQFLYDIDICIHFLMHGNIKLNSFIVKLHVRDIFLLCLLGSFI